MTVPTDPRAHCYRCDKPLSMCVCIYLQPLPNTVGVHILQHPRERRHPLGTARLLRLGLATVQVHVLDLQGDGASTAPLALPEGVGLLYPSTDARDLATLPPEQRPRNLVVIDGTWAHANRVYRDNAWISSLPHYRLDPPEGSRYRIRAEPRPECLSTVESVVAALRCLQPELEGVETLDAAFDAMIDAQIAASSQASTHARGKRPRQKVSQAIPLSLSAPASHIVIVHAEAGPKRSGDDADRDPVRVSATTLDGARVFDRIVQTRHPPDEVEAALWGIGAAELATAASLCEVTEAFRTFCNDVESRAADRPGEPRPATVLVSWGVWTYGWLAQAVTDRPLVLLKGVWSNLIRDRPPALSDVVRGLGLSAPPAPVTGRAGRRLADARAVARHILARKSDGS